MTKGKDFLLKKKNVASYQSFEDGMVWLLMMPTNRQTDIGDTVEVEL